ncbi:hypothetical protein VP01_2254g5 [Puccinia sorghi]|uniref:Uncharacterized protein n=1 Tax=Puccinia sorghi TaxID=27349 RepID=A0A0L6V8F9_9BASI|nr:hypothetical protein VP01_2254g5 [Puccinia sorghi]
MAGGNLSIVVSKAAPSGQEERKSLWSYPVSTIRKSFWKIDHQHSACNISLTGPKAQRALKKYSSHCRIPRAALMDVHIMSG